MIIDKWITFNANDPKMDKLKEVIEALNKLNQFSSDYYQYLIRKEDIKNIVGKINEFIIPFLKDQNIKGFFNDQDLISILKDSSNDDFVIKFVKSIDEKILKEDDFYAQKENKNFKFFKLFLENYDEKMEEKLKECKYTIASTETQTKILDDLKTRYFLMKKIF